MNFIIIYLFYISNVYLIMKDDPNQVFVSTDVDKLREIILDSPSTVYNGQKYKALKLEFSLSIFI